MAAAAATAEGEPVDPWANAVAAGPTPAQVKAAAAAQDGGDKTKGWGSFQAGKAEAPEASWKPSSKAWGGGGRGGGKWSSSQPSGPDLPRKRVTTGKVEGKVLEWKGKYGWIQPTQPFRHPKAAGRQGRIFVSKTDLDNLWELAPGVSCRFHIFEDEAGLGAEEVNVISGSGMPGGGPAPPGPTAGRPPLSGGCADGGGGGGGGRGRGGMGGGGGGGGAGGQWQPGGGPGMGGGSRPSGGGRDKGGGDKGGGRGKGGCGGRGGRGGGGYGGGGDDFNMPAGYEKLSPGGPGGFGGGPRDGGMGGPRGGGGGGRGCGGGKGGPGPMPGGMGGQDFNTGYAPMQTGGPPPAYNGAPLGGGGMLGCGLGLGGGLGGCGPNMPGVPGGLAGLSPAEFSQLLGACGGGMGGMGGMTGLGGPGGMRQPGSLGLVPVDCNFGGCGVQGGLGTFPGFSHTMPGLGATGLGAPFPPRQQVPAQGQGGVPGWGPSPFPASGLRGLPSGLGAPDHNFFGGRG